MDDRFHDDEGGFFFTASDSEALIARYKDQHDGSVPSGNAMAATALVKLACLTSDSRTTQLAEETIKQASYLMHHSPGSVCQMLFALDHLLSPSTEMVYVSSTADGKYRALEHAFAELRPRTLIVLSCIVDGGSNSLSSTRLSGLVEGRECIEGAPTVLYQCSDGSCKPPLEISMRV